MNFQKLFETWTSQLIHTIHTPLFEEIIIRKFGFTAKILNYKRFTN